VRAREGDDDFAAALGLRFRHLFGDEYQDVNPLQQRLLDGWRGTSTALCVVGDPNQATYAWNGAEPTLIRDFPARYAGAAVVQLDVNYRSSPQILAAANAIARADVRLAATRGDGPVPTVHELATDRAEAATIVRTVRDRQGPGVPWSHQAVLVRTNAQSVLLEEAFRAARVPYRVRGRAPFTDLPEVREAIRGLRRAGGALVGAIARLEADLGEDADHDGPAADERRANLAELVRLANEYVDLDPRPTAEAFVSWLAATVRSDDLGARTDAVDLATFHAAKGLEWPIVHLAGMERGLVPIGHARTPEAQAEERRLLYVAITRAERELRLYWARERTFASRTSNRTRSPFLDELEPVFDAMARGEEPVDWRSRMPRRRATPAADRDRDPLFSELRRWRSERAKAANAPAFTIFNDATLTELAQQRPRDRGDLLRVSGIGEIKANRFGDEVLAIVARHVERAG
jgi:DNA helicase-2/ATP-dependent DNA helicase PcrA